MTMKVEQVVLEETMERLVQVHCRQELYNKKSKILLQGQIFFEEIPQAFLQIILENKILELLLEKIKKDFKIGELNKEKENFQTFLKGIINKRKSSINFNFPDTTTYTPSENFLCYLQPNVEEDFSRYLEPSPHFNESTEPRETSFSFSDGNQPEWLSLLRNELRNIAPLPSKPTIDSFARTIKKIIVLQ